MDLTLGEYSVAPGRAVISVAGEIDVYTAPRLREALVSLVDAGNYWLIVDLEGVEFLDSTGLGVLIGGLKRVHAHGGGIDLVCTQGRILRIFRITGLSRVFNIYDSVDEALDASSGGAEPPMVPAGHVRPPGVASADRRTDTGPRSTGETRARPGEDLAEPGKAELRPVAPGNAQGAMIPSASADRNAPAQAAVDVSLLPITIYLSEADGHEQVQSAVERLLIEAGLRIDNRDDPVVGSWFRQMRASAVKASSHPRRTKRLWSPHLSKTRVVLSHDAAITAKLMENLAPVIESLHTTKSAVIRIGALLIVKTDSAVTVQQLTAAQQTLLDHQPQLATAPNEVLAALKISQNGDNDDARSEWDFFVSYTQTDRAWAEWIAWVLEENGYRILIQAWDFVPGSNWVAGMQAGAHEARRTIAVLSDAYLESVYGSAEWQAAWASDPQGADRRLLIVRVTDCDRPGLLTVVTGFDLFGLVETEARDRLQKLVSAAIEGRMKPQVPPRFPGGNRAVPTEPRFPGIQQDAAAERDAYTAARDVTVIHNYGPDARHTREPG